MDSREIAGTVIGTVIKVVVTAVILMFVYRYSQEAFEIGYRIFAEAPMDEKPGRDVTVTISETDSVKDVAERLEKNGLIRDARLFRIREMISGLDEKMAPATYSLNTSMSIEEMLAVMMVEKEKEPEEK